MYRDRSERGDELDSTDDVADMDGETFCSVEELNVARDRLISEHKPIRPRNADPDSLRRYAVDRLDALP